MNIGSIDTTTWFNASFMSQNNKASETNADPGTMADKILQNGIRRNDTDSDGPLSATELDDISQDTFGTLDTDGDGKLNAAESKNAIQLHLEEIRTTAKKSGGDAVSDFQNQLTAPPEEKLAKTPESEEVRKQKTEANSLYTSASQQLSEILASLNAQTSESSPETTNRLNLTA